jgi:tetratricopeptide (TPR) repeat protein
VSAVEKILKKVEQDRSKGNDERALTRLREALSEQPREFVLAREAAELAFQLERTVEAVGILRAAMKRSPQARHQILNLAQEEFRQHSQLEVGELLYDAYLSDPDLDKAREVVEALHDDDRERLLSKLRAKVRSLREDVPDTNPRVVAMLLAEAFTLAAMQRHAEMAEIFDRVLDLDAKQIETIGRMSRMAHEQARNVVPLRLVLARCYSGVGESDMAVEHFAATASDPACRARALHLLGDDPSTPRLREVRAFLLLHEEQFEAAHDALLELVEQSDDAAANVRRVLESVQGAVRATPRLRQIYARVLASTGAGDRAIRELEGAVGGSEGAAANLRIVEEALSQTPNDADAHQLRARLCLELERYTDAAESLGRVLEIDPSRAPGLRQEIEAAFERAPSEVGLGGVLVGILVEMETPLEASEVLQRIRGSRLAPATLLYELASSIASRYGLSAELLAVFLEAAIELGRDDDARAAVAHYYGSAGTRTQDFAKLMLALVEERPELGAGLARALEGMQIPSSLRMVLIRCRLSSDDSQSALGELATLVVENSNLREPALEVLDGYLQEHGDSAQALELAADLLVDGGKLDTAADYLGRALRAEPESSDRVCRRADRVFSEAGARDDVWRPVVFALVDAGRHRHARDLCYRAAQSVPFDRQGFLHVALGTIQLETGQVAAATNAFESSLLCKDVELERVVAGLREAIEIDAQHGHTRYVLARAQLQSGADVDEAVEQLSEAVRLDQMLADLVVDTLSEHASTLEHHGPALALEGDLALRKGERARGVELLEKALRVVPELGTQVLESLQVEWDRDSDSVDTGIVLARALVCCDQHRRACRLLSDLSRRFGDQHTRLAIELERLIESRPLPEAHRALWEILITQGEQDAALAQMQLAVETSASDPDLQRELLESAHHKVSESSWVTCRLARLEMRSGNDVRAELLLRDLVEKDMSTQADVLDALHSEDAPTSEVLALLEIDVLLGAERWQESHAALRRFLQAFPEESEPVLSRLRLLASRGETNQAADFDLAQLLQKYGNIEEAVSVLEKAIEKAPEATEAAAVEPLIEVDVEADEGADADVAELAPMEASETASARLDAGTSAAQSTTSREMRLMLASMYVDLGRVQEGKEVLGSVFQEGHASGDAYQFMQRISTRGLQSKVKQLEEAIDNSPSDLRARLELGRLSILARDFGAAREALGFKGDAPAIESARRYLLARSYADGEQPHLATAVLRSIDLNEIAETELRRNVMKLQARCYEQLGRYGEAHAVYLRIIGEFPDSKEAHHKVRSTYQKHLESCLEPKAIALEKRTSLELR